MFLKNSNEIKILELQLDNIAKAMAFQHFWCSQNTKEQVDFSKDYFLLFDYPNTNSLIPFNLGDNFQTIATRNAIDSIYQNSSYEYFASEYLAYYNKPALRRIVGVR